MWHTLKDKLPTHGETFPIRIHDKRSGKEYTVMALCQQTSAKDFHWIYSNKSLGRMGFSFIAWFEIPECPYTLKVAGE